MLELDEAVRQNQLNCLPISRSARLEAELLDRYPSLIERLERSKMITIDQVALQSRLRERESRANVGRKASADLLDGFEPSPARKSPRLVLKLLRTLVHW